MIDTKILYVKDQGQIKSERIVLEVINNCNIGDYIVFDTTYFDDGISNKLRHTYWFPDKKVNAGDKVILYTKEGSERSKINKSGNESHFFYWDLKETVWNRAEDCAVIIKVEGYKVKKIIT